MTRYNNDWDILNSVVTYDQAMEEVIDRDPETFLDKCLCLFYYAEYNHFEDENGIYVPNIFEYVLPGYLEIFRAHGRSILVPMRGQRDQYVILFADEDDLEEEIVCYI